MDVPNKLEIALERLAQRDATISELRSDLADRDSSLKTTHLALTRICEIIGASAPVAPNNAVQAVEALLCASEGHNLRANRAEATLREIDEVLKEHDLPTHYNPEGHPHDKGAVIPNVVERVRVGLMILRDKWVRAHYDAQKFESKANWLNDERYAAAQTLDALGAPRQAGGNDLDLDIRIRALMR